MSENLLPINIFIAHLLQKLVHVCIFGFNKKERFPFDKEIVIFGQMSDDKIIYLIIINIDPQTNVICVMILRI